MTTLFLYDEASVTPEQVAQVIREQINEGYGFSDGLRTAAMYCPLTMTPKTWVAGALLAGIKENTARNRLNEVRRDQRELGEI